MRICSFHIKYPGKAATCIKKKKVSACITAPDLFNELFNEENLFNEAENILM